MHSSTVNELTINMFLDLEEYDLDMIGTTAIGYEKKEHSFLLFGSLKDVEEEDSFFENKSSDLHAISLHVLQTMQQRVRESY